MSVRRAPVFILGLIVTLSLGAAAPAYADVAPPQNPPGASIKNGQADTNVQMVSETVVMTISDYQPTATDQQNFVAPFMQGHVDATFVMQNQGASEESFDVWFPIGADTGMGRVATVDNFTAYVDGAEATNVGQEMTKGQFDQQVPWATWPATFPPGQQVTLRVTYDTFPTGYQPYGRFEYILETGAGWNGPIGEGTVIFRLPYEVNELNVALGQNKDYYSPAGGMPSVSGTDVVWHFTGLEPTTDNNIGLTVLDPSVWTGIQQAQANADASPDSAQAQLDLGNALSKGLQWKYELLNIGGSLRLYDKAVEAYERALELEPDNVDVYSGYLGLLQNKNSLFGKLDPRYVQMVDRALQLAPDNKDFIELKNNLNFGLTQMATQGTIVAPPPTFTPVGRPSDQGGQSPQDAANPAAVAEAATSTPTPAIIAPELPGATPSPTPAGPPTGTGAVIAIALVIGGVLIAAALVAGIWLGRRSK